MEKNKNLDNNQVKVSLVTTVCELTVCVRENVNDR